MNKEDAKNLKKRYLIWLYKTNKEALDKIERKFTQADIDKFILVELIRQDEDRKLQKFVAEFKAYIENKEKEGAALKFEGREPRLEYQFLALKLKAIEKAIVKALGKRALGEIKFLYEMEMVERILKSTEH